MRSINQYIYIPLGSLDFHLCFAHEFVMILEIYIYKDVAEQFL